ncbi:LexA/Signal peptidase [Polychaeton citri CBS 116435]|uniref:LexA/Signal peptidase n=1 Tax=Polychaeton citri CBS 116435 TaxID=1314669 RepID=A0A9P4UL41_9PEZI|nr:LexA/Signal peptidase [Polychaeton citri CBS 116435]
MLRYGTSQVHINTSIVRTQRSISQIYRAVSTKQRSPQTGYTKPLIHQQQVGRNARLRKDAPPLPQHPLRPNLSIRSLLKKLQSHFPLRQTLYLLRFAIAAFLAFHIFTEYFYALGLSYGISMLPTISSSGDWLLISKHYRRGRNIALGDVVAYKHPIVENGRAVKRVVGMPGDFVLRDSPGVVEGEGKMLQVPQGHCYLVGDNLAWSRDSRIFGPVPLALIRGKVIAKFSMWEFFTGRWTILDRGLQEAEG